MIQGCKHGGHNDSGPIKGTILWGHLEPVYSPDSLWVYQVPWSSIISMHKQYGPYFEVSTNQVFCTNYFRRCLNYFQKIPERGFQLGATAPEVDGLPMYHLASLLSSFYLKVMQKKINKELVTLCSASILRGRITLIYFFVKPFFTFSKCRTKKKIVAVSSPK